MWVFLSIWSWLLAVISVYSSIVVIEAAHTSDSRKLTPAHYLALPQAAVLGMTVTVSAHAFNLRQRLAPQHSPCLPCTICKTRFETKRFSDQPRLVKTRFELKRFSDQPKLVKHKIHIQLIQKETNS